MRQFLWTVRGKQEPAIAPQPPRQEMQEFQTGRVGPVDIFQGDDQRSLRSELLQHPVQAFEQTALLLRRRERGVRLNSGEQLREFREELHDLGGIWPEQPGDLRGTLRVQEATERLDEWRVRQRGLEQGAPAVENPALPLLHPHRQLGKQPTLADPCLSCQKDDIPPTPTG